MKKNQHQKCELGTSAELPSEIREALVNDRTIDLATKGAKTGRWRTTEIWFTRFDERVVICGTPGANGEGGAEYHPRSWLANLKKSIRGSGFVSRSQFSIAFRP